MCAYVIPPTSHELLQQLLDEVKGLRHDFQVGIQGSLEITPEQTDEIVRQVQAKLRKDNSD